MSNAESALQQLLSAAHFPCPKCEYDLYGTSVSRCPECNCELALAIVERGAKRNRLAIWLLVFLWPAVTGLPAIAINLWLGYKSAWSATFSTPFAMAYNLSAFLIGIVGLAGLVFVVKQRRRLALAGPRMMALFYGMACTSFLLFLVLWGWQHLRILL